MLSVAQDFDQQYFDRWYRDPRHRVKTNADVRRQALLAVSAAEWVLDRPIRRVLHRCRRRRVGSCPRQIAAEGSLCRHRAQYVRGGSVRPAVEHHVRQLRRSAPRHGACSHRPRGVLRRGGLSLEPRFRARTGRTCRACRRCSSPRDLHAARRHHRRSACPFIPLWSMVSRAASARRIRLLRAPQLCRASRARDTRRNGDVRLRMRPSSDHCRPEIGP